MTRAETIKKLANACKEYRGLKNEASGQWIRVPKPSALPRIKAHITRLNLDEAITIIKIESFETIQQFNAWLKSLEIAENPHLVNWKLIKKETPCSK